MTKKRGLSGIVNGTTYSDEASTPVINALEQARESKQRVCILYGDTKTGRAWGNKEDRFRGMDCGTIGRSMGPVKIPLLIKSKRSSGGEGLLTGSIVAITSSTTPRRILYRHPKFRQSLTVFK